MTRVLVIDDDAMGREVIREMLEASGYEVVIAATATEALVLFSDEEIRLVVSDIVMPDLSGLELLEAMRLHRPTLPIVLVTGANTHDNLTEALMRGADGLVAKPFTQIQLQEAVGKALERAGRSEQEIRDRLLAPTLTSALANAIEAREEGMRGHCERLTVLAMHLGLAARASRGGDRDPPARRAPARHRQDRDPGQRAAQGRVLNEEETALMRTHTVIGDNLLEPLDLLAAVRPIVRHHHERWDGAGYPDGLAGEAIPLGARIIAVADAVEAMSASRVYREPLTEPEIVRELERGRGTRVGPEDRRPRAADDRDGRDQLFRGRRVRLEVLPHRASAAVLRFPGPRSREELSAGRRSPPVSAQPIRCLVADDHPALVAAVSDFLESNGFEVVGQAQRRPGRCRERQGDEARHRARRLPDAAARGRRASRAAAGEAPETLIAVYTADSDQSSSASSSRPAHTR